MANNIISKLMVRLGLDNSKFKGGLKQSEEQAKGFGRAMKSIGTAIGGYFAFSSVLAGIKKVLNTNREFEKSLSTLRSLTGVSKKELEFFADEAVRLGETTTQTASQVAKAFTLIGSKKPDLLQSKEALAAVTEQAIILAEAAGIDVTQAATALANSLNQMGENADSADRFINALAAGSKFGAGNVAYLNAAIEKSGGTAAATGLSFEELVGAIETIAPKIAEPTTAGLQLRQVLVRLQKETDAYNPSVVGLAQALKNLQKEQLTINDLTQKFGIQNVSAAKALIDGADSFEEYTKKVTGTNTALEQQNINIDNLDGDINQLSSAWEGLVLKIQESQGELRAFTQLLTQTVRDISGASVKLTTSDFAKGALAELVEKTEKEGTQLARVLNIAIDDTEKQLEEAQLRYEKLGGEFGLIKGGVSAITGGFLFGNELKQAEVDAAKLRALLELLTAKRKQEGEKIIQQEQERVVKSLNLEKQSIEQLNDLRGNSADFIVAAIDKEIEKRGESSNAEIRNIKNLSAELEQLKVDRENLTDDALANTNKRIEDIKAEIKELENLGLAINKIKPIDIQAIQGGLDTRALDQTIQQGEPTLPLTLTTEGTFGASEQIKQLQAATQASADYAAKQDLIAQKNMMVQQSAAAYGSILSSVGQIAQVSGDSQIASVLNVASATIQAVASMIPSLFSQATGSAVASGAALPFPANIVAIAAGVAAVASAFSGLGGGSGGGGSAPVTSIDTRRMTSPSTNISTRTNTTQQSIKVEVEGRIDNKTIALANKKGTKELNR